MIQEYTQAIKDLTQETINDIHTAMPGRIVSFNPDKCEAAVLPLGKFRKPDGALIDFPVINEVPVFFPQGMGQTASIVYPVKSGDECWLMFGEQALDQWRAGRLPAPLPGTETRTELRFDLTNAICIVGLFARANPLVKEAIAKNAVIINRNGTQIMLLPNNAVDVIGNTTIHGTLTVTDDVTAQRNVSIAGNEYIDGSTAIMGSESVEGIITVGGIAGGGSGHAILDGNLHVRGNVTIDGSENLWNEDEDEYIRINTHIHATTAGETSDPKNKE